MRPCHGSRELIAQDRESLDREFPKREGEHRGPARHGGPISAPVVNLAGSDAAEAGEAGLADVCLAQ